MPGIVSITDNSNTDCALSVTGPYESTAIVTGPMPRNPNATSPKAKTAGASIRLPSPVVLNRYAIPINASIAMPSQKALKFPATKPDRMLSDAPPSRDDVTTSRTCDDLSDVNTVTSSGMIAPASVPQVITSDSFHHRDGSPPTVGMMSEETMNVNATDTRDVNHTSWVRGAS